MGTDGHGTLGARITVEVVGQPRNRHTLPDERRDGADEMQIAIGGGCEPARVRVRYVVGDRAARAVTERDRLVRSVVFYEHPGRVAEAVLDGPRKRVQHQDRVVVDLAVGTVDQADG